MEKQVLASFDDSWHVYNVNILSPACRCIKTSNKKQENGEKEYYEDIKVTLVSFCIGKGRIMERNPASFRWILMSLLTNNERRERHYFKTRRNARTATTGSQVQCQCPRRGVTRLWIYDWTFSWERVYRDGNSACSIYV